MRTVAIIIAALIIAAPAAAESWKEYNSPEYGFTVTFPVDPKQENATYQSADGRNVPAHIWSASQNRSTFKVTVAEIGTAGQEDAIIDHAIPYNPTVGTRKRSHRRGSGNERQK